MAQIAGSITRSDFVQRGLGRNVGLAHLDIRWITQQGSVLHDRYATVSIVDHIDGGGVSHSDPMRIDDRTAAATNSTCEVMPGCARR